MALTLPFVEAMFILLFMDFSYTEYVQGNFIDIVADAMWVSKVHEWTYISWRFYIVCIYRWICLYFYIFGFVSLNTLLNLFIT